MISLRRRGDVERFSFQDYIAQVESQVFGFAGTQYPVGIQGTYGSSKVEAIEADLPGYMRALKECPPAFAAQLTRGLVLSQAFFQFRNTRRSTRPGKTFGTVALNKLERPWKNSSTAELITRMEWHVGLAGNSFVRDDYARGRLQVLRPDWVRIVLGSQSEPDDPAGALDGELIGYAYCNGGWKNPNAKPITLLPEEVAHWSPLPDPEATYRGMSWMTPALRDIQADRATTTHKLKFFENAGTPNLVFTGLRAPNEAAFNDIVRKIDRRHNGVRNAFKSIYLQEGADVTVVGADMKGLDLANVQGRGETRIAMLSKVPAPILQISEGLQGSSLNAGNWSQARRNFADIWIYPTLTSLCAALGTIVKAPTDAELWWSTADMPLLREDAKDQAEILTAQVTAVKTAVEAGFTADSAVAAIQANDVSLLQHSGLLSVQLQKPGAGSLPTA